MVLGNNVLYGFAEAVFIGVCTVAGAIIGGYLGLISGGGVPGMISGAAEGAKLGFLFGSGIVGGIEANRQGDDFGQGFIIGVFMSAITLAFPHIAIPGLGYNLYNLVNTNNPDAWANFIGSLVGGYFSPRPSDFGYESPNLSERILKRVDRYLRNMAKRFLNEVFNNLGPPSFWPYNPFHVIYGGPQGKGGLKDDVIPWAMENPNDAQDMVRENTYVGASVSYGGTSILGSRIRYWAFNVNLKGEINANKGVSETAHNTGGWAGASARAYLGVGDPNKPLTSASLFGRSFSGISPSLNVGFSAVADPSNPKGFRFDAGQIGAGVCTGYGVTAAPLSATVPEY